MKKIIITLAVLTLCGFAGSAQNTSFGVGALGSITTGTDNSAFGAFSLTSTTTGHINVGIGHSALYSNISGSQNIGIGYAALYSNTTGTENIGIGTKTLGTNTTGTGNVGIGEGTLNANTTGSFNIGAGYYSLLNNIDGRFNVSLGYFAMANNSSGLFNHAIGYEALKSNVDGENNTAIGQWSMFDNTSGAYNYAIGYAALYGNTTGKGNVAHGGKALAGNITGDNNTGIGISAGPNSGALFNTTALGADATTTASNQVRIGNTSVTSIGGYAAWTNLSDGRFKSDIQENVVGLKFINGLRPVSYTVDVAKLDAFLGTDKGKFYTSPEGSTVYQTGFIAQEVEELVDETGFIHFNGVDKPENEKDHYGLRYAEFVVPLVKSVQELSANQDALLAKIEDLERRLASSNGDLKSDNAAVQIEGYDLQQNVPNPANSATRINMTLPSDALNTQLIIYNLEGKQLKVIPVQGTGETSVTIQANDFEAGLYVYALISNNKVIATKQMILTNN